MAELYDTASNGGFSEFKFTGAAAPGASNGEDTWDISALNAAANATGTKQISIVGAQWIINGGGTICVEAHDASGVSDAPLLVFAGNGSLNTGTHGINFSPILQTAAKGIKLIEQGTITGYTVIIKIRKETGFGYNDPR